jgi:hypothetical protein
MVRLICYLRLVPGLQTVTSTSSLRFQAVVFKHRASMGCDWSTAEIILHGKKCDGVILSKEKY